MNYTTLVSALVEWSHNDSTELRTSFPVIIENAIRRIGKEVDAVGLNVTTTVSVDAGSPFVTIPQDVYVINHVVKTSAGRKEFLKHRPYDYLLEAWPDSTSVGGNPSHYTRLNDTTLYVVPTPTSTQTLELRNVTVSIPTSATTDSFVLNRYPEMVLAACMAEVALFMKDNEDATVWNAKYEAHRSSVENEARRNRRDSGDVRNTLNNIQNSNNLREGKQ